MTEENRQDGGGDGALSSSLERVAKELVEFAAAQVHHVVSKAGGRVTDVAERAGESVQGAASLPKLGARMAGGATKKGAKSVAGTVKQAVGGGGGDGDDGDGGGGGGGGGKGKGGGTKVTNIIETIDVGLPLRDCYNHWTEYESFGDFMKGVQGVQRSDEVESDWKLKIGPSSRGWHATVQEQVPDERIEWTSEGAKGSTRGVVTFHELAPRLTRIVVVVEYYPAGFFEKTANLWRAQGRRLRLDLKHFQRHVTLEADEVPEGWRGTIRDGEVVVSHEDALADEKGGDEEEDGDSEDREEDGEHEDEHDGEDSEDDEGDEDDEDEDEDEEDDDEDDEDDDEERERW